MFAGPGTMAPGLRLHRPDADECAGPAEDAVPGVSDPGLPPLPVPDGPSACAPPARPPAFSAFRPDVRFLLDGLSADAPLCFAVAGLEPLPLAFPPAVHPADAYVFVEARPDGSRAVRLWVGPSAAADKRFVAAALAAGCKASLAAMGGGVARVFREEPGDETPAFLAMFPRADFVVDGAAEPWPSALISVGEAPGSWRRFRGRGPSAVPRFRVYRWAKGRLVHAAPVLHRDGGGVTVVDLQFGGCIVHCARNPESARDRLQATLVAASRMLAWDHGGDGRMVVLEEDWRDYATGEEEEAWTFLDRLGLPILDGPSDDGPPVVPRISLYRIDDIAVEGFDPARLDAYRVPLPGSYIPDRSYLGGPRSICALDAGTELFLWTGSAADPSAGTDLLAALVPLDPRRPRWTDVRRFRDGSGPTSESFRQKFARWEERGQFDPLSMVKPPRPPPAVDWGPLLGPSLPDPPPADDLSVSGLTHDADDADAQISSFLFSERTRTFLSHPARPPLDDETWVHLHSRPSVPSCAAYLWRGRHAPLLGRAAFLLRTTGQLAEAVAERWGCKLEVVDAPQGREPDALLGLLGGYVEVRRREARDGMMHLRAAKCRVRATEVLASVARLDCFGAAILQRGQGGPVLWIGRRARRAAREALLDACAEILAGRSASRPSVVEQGSEPEWFWDLLPDGASHHLAELAPARLLTVSCAEGLYRIAEEQPEQWNLRRASCALVFRLGAEAYLWIGAEASEAVRRFAAETIGRFEAITGHKVEEVLQGEETDGFTGCFACWDERPRQLRVFSRSTVHH